MKFEMIMLIAASFLCAISSIVDIKTRLIPNLVPILFVILGFIRIIVNVFNAKVIMDMVAGLFLSTALCLTCWLVSKSGLGMGDVKLILAMGFCIGFKMVTGILLITCIFSFMYGLVRLVFYKDGKNTTYPFAPFVLIGVVCYTVVFILRRG